MFAWTEANVAELKRLNAEGLSAAAIGRRTGISRNAVIGKLWRLDIPKSSAPKAKPFSKMAWNGNGVSKPPLILDAKPGPELPPLKDAKGKPYTALTIPFTGKCKFPYVDPKAGGGHIFCAHPQFASFPYCEAHARLCYGKGA